MPAKRDLPNVNDLIHRYQAGESMKCLAGEVGIARHALARQFVERGVEIRGRSDAERAKWRILKRDPAAVRRQVQAANAAARGRVHSFEERCKRAATAAARLLRRFSHEDPIAELLRARGLPVIQQIAVGPYNVDIAHNPSRVAVEIVGCQMGKRRNDTYPKRLEYILDQGWFVLLVNLRNWRLGVSYSAICDQIVALAKRSGRTQSLVGQYGVIGRDGKPLPRSRHYLHGRTNVFAANARDE